MPGDCTGDPAVDVPRTHEAWGKFKKWLNNHFRRNGNDVAYFWVLELQTRGVPHYHVLLRSEKRITLRKRLRGSSVIGYTPLDNRVEGFGFGWIVDCQLVQHKHGGTVVYLSKYLSKGMNSQMRSYVRRYEIATRPTKGYVNVGGAQTTSGRILQDVQGVLYVRGSEQVLKGKSLRLYGRSNNWLSEAQKGNKGTLAFRLIKFEPDTALPGMDARNGCCQDALRAPLSKRAKDGRAERWLQWAIDNDIHSLPAGVVEWVEKRNS